VLGPSAVKVINWLIKPPLNHVSIKDLKCQSVAIPVMWNYGVVVAVKHIFGNVHCDSLS